MLMLASAQGNASLTDAQREQVVALATQAVQMVSLTAQVSSTGTGETTTTTGTTVIPVTPTTAATASASTLYDGFAHQIRQSGGTLAPSIPTVNIPDVQMQGTVALGTGPGAKVTIYFNSTDPSNGKVNYTVDWGDQTTPDAYAGASFSQPQDQHTYLKSGTYTITVTATNDAGESSSNAQTIHIIDYSSDVTAQAAQLGVTVVCAGDVCKINGGPSFFSMIKMQDNGVAPVLDSAKRSNLLAASNSMEGALNLGTLTGAEVWKVCWNGLVPTWTQGDAVWFAAQHPSGGANGFFRPMGTSGAGYQFGSSADPGCPAVQ